MAPDGARGRSPDWIGLTLLCTLIMVGGATSLSVEAYVGSVPSSEQFHPKLSGIVEAGGIIFKDSNFL